MAFIAPRTYRMPQGILVIQSAQVHDAREIIHTIQQIETETDFLVRMPGEVLMTVEEERRFIENKLSHPREVFLIARFNDLLVGTLSFTVSRYARYSHRGEFGISVLRNYWRLGIGKRLMETLIEWADAMGFVKISLEVDASNTRAIRLYKSFGFHEEGYLKMDRLLESGEFRDSYIMARINPFYSNTQRNSII